MRKLFSELPVFAAYAAHCFVLCAYVDAVRRRDISQGYRLPDDIIPKKYAVEVNTNLDGNDFSFDGEVWIELEVMKPTNKIVLHSVDLAIKEDKVWLKKMMGNNESDVPISSHNYQKENEFYIVMLNQQLVPGSSYVYHIPFSGNLTEGLAGYYRSSYLDRASNTTKWLAVTQFESTDARRAFPCFDEPAFKATFAISLGHSNKFKSISNMPLLESTPVKGKDSWVMNKFEETVPMSTYLVAYMVSEFEYAESDNTEDLKNVTFRIWARKEAIGQVSLAKTVGPKVLSYFEEYFNTKYPLPKQDMAAIPDFSAGAMENWGLITYRETALLYDEQSASVYVKHRIAEVIAHELAHQWFGNLVTMKWWTDLWLNEGFASYVGTLGVHKLFPGWNSLDSTHMLDFLTVLSLDALKSSHPVSVPIDHPSKIQQIFDTISYKKGSYLLRMINLVLGEEVFKKGVTNYLRKHKYSNAAQDDLWESLTDSAHSLGSLDSAMDVKTIMDTWTLQTGYPLITVSRDYDTNKITISQERYLSLVPKKDEPKKQNDSKECWWVPISYTSSRDLKFNVTKPKTWLKCNNTLSLNTAANDDQWVIFNIKAAGLYRVNYDERNWKLLQETLNNQQEYSKIDPLNRVQLISDALSLAWIGKMDYKMAFDLINYLKYETNYITWRTALSSLNDIKHMLLRTPTLEYYKKFVRAMLEPVFRKLGNLTNVPSEYEDIKYHTLIVAQSCGFGVADCNVQTVDLFNRWISESNPDQNNPIPKDLRGIVYCDALKQGGQKYFEFLWSRYQKSNVATEQQQILNTLSCVKDPLLLRRLLRWSIDPTKIRKQDSTFVFTGVVQNEEGYYLARDFFFNKFMVIQNYHSATNKLGRYVKSIAVEIATQDELQEFESFTNSKSFYLKEAELSLKQGIESATINIAWRDMHFKSLTRYLSVR